MKSKRYHAVGSSANTLWLTFFEEPNSFIIRSQLLGLGPDHSLICALPENLELGTILPGTLCQGRSLLDGDAYQFKTVVQEIVANPPTIRLKSPTNNSRQPARMYPRLPVEFSGTVRPLDEKGQVMAVLPVTLNNLCPTGCQFVVPSSSWPSMTTMRVLLFFQFPDSSHSSKFYANIEWINPTSELYIGTQFSSTTRNDSARQDLHQWFTSQKAKLINTVV